jgi:hypothetical protein
MRGSPACVSSQQRLEGADGWPWGLVVLADPVASAEPSDDYNDLEVAAAPSIVLVRVLHGQEGKAKAVLSRHPLTKPRICAYEGTFETVSGLVSMSDAANEDVQVLEAIKTHGESPRRPRRIKGHPGPLSTKSGTPSATKTIARGTPRRLSARSHSGDDDHFRSIAQF